MLSLLFLAAKPSFFENRPMIPLPFHEPSSSFWPSHARARPWPPGGGVSVAAGPHGGRGRAPRAAATSVQRAAQGAVGAGRRSARARRRPLHGPAAMMRPVRSARPGPRTGATARAIQRGGAVLCHPVVGRAAERGRRDWCVGTCASVRCSTRRLRDLLSSLFHLHSRRYCARTMCTLLRNGRRAAKWGAGLAASAATRHTSSRSA